MGALGCLANFSSVTEDNENRGLKTAAAAAAGCTYIYRGEQICIALDGRGKIRLLTHQEAQLKPSQSFPWFMTHESKPFTVNSELISKDYVPHAKRRQNAEAPKGT